MALHTGHKRREGSALPGLCKNRLIGPTVFQPTYRHHHLMHVIFQLPELIANVFGFLGQSDLCCTARVCQWWFDPSISLIWKIFDGDLVALISLLGKIKVIEGYKWVSLSTTSLLTTYVYNTHSGRDRGTIPNSVG